MSALNKSLTGSTLPPLTVETLVNGGAGLARYEGRVVFIPHTSVGDIVHCRVTKDKKKFLEAKLCEIIQPSLKRRKPICPVAGDCGGCHWQHLPYSEQLFWKEKLFRETLTHQCRVDPNIVLPIVPAANEWNYRSRIQIKCHNTHAGFETGFYRTKSHKIVPFKECPIIAPELNTLLTQVSLSINNTVFARYISQIDFGVDDCGCCSVVIHYSGPDMVALSELFNEVNLPAALFIKSPSRNELKNIYGNDSLQLVVDKPPIILKYAVGSFAQINLEQNRLLIDMVLKLAELTGSEQVLDLYCGMGNFSLPLARRARHVIGVEESAVSINTARINGRLNNIDNIEFYKQSSSGALSQFSKQNPIDLLLLDPPRSGAFATMNELQTTPVKRIIYVSCDPQTLARDVKFLVNSGYELLSSQPIDMFPQTYHCESVTLLTYRG